MSKGTTPRAIRLDDDLWRAALAEADRCGVTVSEVVREALKKWIAENESGDGADRSPLRSDQDHLMEGTPCERLSPSSPPLPPSA